MRTVVIHDEDFHDAIVYGKEVAAAAKTRREKRKKANRGPAIHGRKPNRSFTEIYFAEHASRYGLEPSNYGRFFTHEGVSYYVAGIKETKPGRMYRILPILCRRDRDDVIVVFPATIVRKALAK